MNFEDARKIVINAYGKGADGDPDDDPCFYCEEDCGGEPIYEEDYPEFEVDDTGKPICPICGCAWG